MERPLVPVSLSFIAGIILGEVFNFFPLTTTLIILLLIFIEPVIARYRPIPSSSLLFLIMIIGMIYYQYSSNRISADDVSYLNDKGELTLTGEVSAPVKHHKDRIVVIIRAREIGEGRGPRPVSGYLRMAVYGDNPDIQYGDIIMAKVKLRRPGSFKNQGSFDYEKYLMRRGIRSTTSTKSQEIKKIGVGGWKILRYIYSVREGIRVKALNSLDQDLSPIFMAMIIGETGYITDGIRDDFMYSGTTHILSISGSHLALVALLIFNSARVILLYMPSRLLLRMGEYIIPSRAAAAATIPPLILYTLITGSEVATVRSLIMASIYLIAILIEREDDILNALAFAAVVILTWDPDALWDISFQLSFVSVLFIGLALENWSKWKNKDKVDEGDHRISEAASVWQKIGSSLLLCLIISAGAMIGTAPLVIYYFHQLPWVGIAANLAVSPVVGVFVLPAGLVSAFISYLFNSSGLIFSGLNNIVLLTFYKIVHIFASIPLSDIHLSLSLPSVIFLLLLFIILMWSVQSLKGWRVCLTTAILISIITFESGIIQKRSGEIMAVYLDVGQGDSSVIEFPDGKVMIIDGGGLLGDLDLGRAVVAPYLWEKGIRKIDYLVSTHPQLDHMGGLNYLIERFRIGEVWTNGVSRETDFYKKFQHLIAEKGLIVRHPKRGLETAITEDCRILTLNPPDGEIADKLNNNSIVLSISCQGISFLFPGDIEGETERDLVESGNIFQWDIIKVPHHGSRGSLDYSFIKRVNPKVAVVSVGRYNPYGHPADEAIKTYKDIGAEVLRTDRDGAILIRKNKVAFRLTRYIDLLPKMVEINSNILTSEIENIKRLFLYF